jgi:integrase
MAKETLSAKDINDKIAAEKDVKLADGDRLYFRLRAKRSSWFILFTSPATGKRREIPISWAPSDPVKAADLAAVRAAADRIRKQIAEGIDPLAARKGKAQTGGTFAEKARAYLDRKEPIWTPTHYGVQERLLLGLGPDASKASLNQRIDYLAPLRSRPVEEITADEIGELLLPYWKKAPGAATKALYAIDAVIAAKILPRWKALPKLAAEVIAYRPEEAPSQRLNRRTGELISGVPDEERHHPAAPWQAMPAIWSGLSSEGTVAALGAMFCLATMQRASTVARTTWDHIDLDARLWNIPAQLMKGKHGKRRKHTMPLSDAAMAVLARLPTRKGPVFPSVRGAKNIGTDTMRLALQRVDGCKDVTLHGTTRSSFIGWAKKHRPAHDVVLIEAIEAHALSEVQKAYHRDHLPLDGMADILKDYAAHLMSAVK